MKRFLAMMFVAALGASLTAPATADTDTVGQKVKAGVEKTKDVAEKVGDKIKTGAIKTKDALEKAGNKIEDKANDVKDRMRHRGARHHQNVMAAQQALKDKGHDPGMIDGKMGPRTRAAVADYQKAEGLRQTGRLDDDTRDKLGM